MTWLRNKIAEARYVARRIAETYRANGLFDTLWRIARALYVYVRSYYPWAILLYQRLTSPDPHAFYYAWWANHAPRQADLDLMAQTVRLLPQRPVISIIMPTYNTPETFLREAIESVQAQIYPYWELCIADDASTEPRVREQLESYARTDDRIKLVFRSENGHISRASNSALEVATGEFVSLLDHDDLLTPDALYQVALEINLHPDVDVIYSDEDKIDSLGRQFEPHFKAAWCPDTLLSHMYIGHLTTYRRRLVEEVGGFRPEFDGSQDYDLALRVTERTDRIRHIPKVLYHWRVHEASAASSTAAKPYAYEASRRALTEALERRNTPGHVELSPFVAGVYIMRYERPRDASVSILIPTRDQPEVLSKCLDSVFEKSTYKNYDVIVIDNGSTLPATHAVFDGWLTREPKRFRVVPFNEPFNFSKMNNLAARTTDSEFLIFLNDDTEVVTPDWIERMLEYGERSWIGAVGVRLLYPHGRIQHAGIALDAEYIAAGLYCGVPGTLWGYAGRLITVNNYSAVTGACLMCTRELFEKIGGFDESLPCAYNDIDLCLKFVEQGRHNVWLPHVTLIHHESRSRGYETDPVKQRRLEHDAVLMRNRWMSYLNDDPCFSPHLMRQAPWLFNIKPRKRNSAHTQ